MSKIFIGNITPLLFLAACSSGDKYYYNTIYEDSESDGEISSADLVPSDPHIHPENTVALADIDPANLAGTYVNYSKSNTYQVGTGERLRTVYAESVVHIVPDGNTVLIKHCSYNCITTSRGDSVSFTKQNHLYVGVYSSYSGEPARYHLLDDGSISREFQTKPYNEYDRTFQRTYEKLIKVSDEILTDFGSVEVSNAISVSAEDNVHYYVQHFYDRNWFSYQFVFPIGDQEQMGVSFYLDEGNSLGESYFEGGGNGFNSLMDFQLWYVSDDQEYTAEMEETFSSDFYQEGVSVHLNILENNQTTIRGSFLAQDEFGAQLSGEFDLSQPEFPSWLYEVEINEFD